MLSPLEQFIVNNISFIPGLSNSTFSLILIGLILFVINEISIQHPWSTWMHLILNFHNIILNMTNEHLGENTNYFPFIWSLFIFICLTNLLGLTPIVYAPTTQLILTLTLSLSIWMGAILIGIRQHGLNYSGSFVPGGTPLMLTLLMVPIEILSFIASGLSLGLSLCINVTTGHLLQIIIGEFAQQILNNGLNSVKVTFILASLLPLLCIWTLMYLELGIMIMQAYVFTTLTLIYISESEQIH